MLQAYTPLGLQKKYRCRIYVIDTQRSEREALGSFTQASSGVQSSVFSRAAAEQRLQRDTLSRELSDESSPKPSSRR
jgi:hypothetical protein